MNLDEIKSSLESNILDNFELRRRIINILDRHDNKESPGGGYKQLGDELCYPALYEYFFKNNVDEFKQYYSLCGNLVVESCKYPNGWGMENTHEFIYGLLSDNQELISKFVALSTSNLNSAIFKSQLAYEEAKTNPEVYDYRYATYALQCVLKKDWEMVFKLREFNHKNSVKFILHQFEFYQALYEGNEKKLEEMILYFLKSRVVTGYNKYVHQSYSGKLYSYHAVFFMKLAWMFGHEIYIKHPLLPMDLMPIKPLKHYMTIDEFFDRELSAYNAKLHSGKTSIWGFIKSKFKI